MPLSSMTGYAHTAFEAAGEKFSWELKSVNARGLEIRLRLPPGHDGLEPEVRGLARQRLARGTCFFVLEQEGRTEQPRLTLNEEALALVVAAARRLATVDGIAMPTADGLLAIPGVLQDRAGNRAGENAELRDAAILDALGRALDFLKAARLEEGRRLQSILEGQLATIARLVEEAAVVAAEAPAILKARIHDQVAALISDKLNLDPDRLHQEAVLAATRADVREELDRLTSHLAAVRQLIEPGDNVGRRLDFLSQEFNREANTLCSKAFDKRLTAIGVEMKAVIDQFREQVQNLE